MASGASGEFIGAIATHTQPNYKPLHAAAYNGHSGHNLCVALLLLADDSILRVKDKYGRTPVDMARKNNNSDIAAAMEKWASGDKAGALRDLGAAHLISSHRVLAEVQACGLP